MRKSIAVVLVVMAYSYLASAFIGWGITRFRHRGGRGSGETPSARDAGADARNSAPSAPSAAR